MPDNVLKLNNLEKTAQSKKSKLYHEQFQKEICALIEQIDLPDLQKQFMKARWLDQLLWLEDRTQTNRNQYYFLRLLTIIGGVIVPALVSLNINANDVKVVVGWLAFGLSQVVAISAAVEEFFHYGERYRHYRNTAEAMKIEGWQFLQLSGSYRHAQNHAEVYPDFAQRVENIIQRDVEGYFSKVVQEKEKPKQG
ncbi:MAG: DUF4231 domain-containing protein [Microcystis aeruginosa LL13-03]|jgi:hypothetical protein|nr:DUF4231 domain-containing protein [Microcystis aeruginosa SX13-11]NCR18423.1 DUF4231 domain-containing protein [Microcystis aeruginosa LL13-03]NCR44493.1 DUF4231 domain-containing protein [Microcystis aeruginosa SX13-01]NCR68000.1 DUF4231 domain-containing protein [Microcystis aeruginosa LL11-07]NCR91565.1 DUF4231 domain-containing protein [Microcystis aeruginosa G13-10]NCS09060.1 DUF4231 domain-containing protein [Microcystis aeruginosa G13-07]NCS16929.1 DUF4231 domain-containing protein 